MKKLLSVILAAGMLFSLIGCTQTGNEPTDPTEPVPAVRESFIKDPMILNADGSYGGSLDEAKYGAGAPLNGEYDVPDSDYYTVNNDFFNMTSTEQRMIYPNFSTYQQTMEDSSALACLLMVLNYMGEDVVNIYNEKALVEKYEQVNNTTVYGNGTTKEGLVALIDSLDLGYTVSHKDDRFFSYQTESRMKEFLMDCLQQGQFLLIGYTSPTGYDWKLVVGYDTVGNVKKTTDNTVLDALYDDIIIFAEPNDGYDHMQDGFATDRAKTVYNWWCDRGIDGNVSEKYSFVVIDTNMDVDFDPQPVDTSVKQTLYDIHLPLNPDGTYGGSRPGTNGITSGRGWYNHTDANYYKINDFYNMGSEGSRLLLSNYTVLQQTMGASCGLCAVGSVLKYYGDFDDVTYYDFEKVYQKQYGDATGQPTTSTTYVWYHYEAVTDWGYAAQWGGTQTKQIPQYDTYEEYMQFFRSNLEEGRPVVVSTFIGSWHFVTVIGIDDMGTDYIYDDVIIVADSCDSWDHYQDGYNVFNAYRFFRNHSCRDYYRQQNYIVIYPKDEQ